MHFFSVLIRKCNFNLFVGKYCHNKNYKQILQKLSFNLNSFATYLEEKERKFDLYYYLQKLI